MSRVAKSAKIKAMPIIPDNFNPGILPMIFSFLHP